MALRAAVSCARPRMPSFAYDRLRWVATVRSLRNSVAAMSLSHAAPGEFRHLAFGLGESGHGRRHRDGAARASSVSTRSRHRT